MPVDTYNINASANDAAIDGFFGGYDDTSAFQFIGYNGGGSPANWGAGFRFTGINLSAADTINAVRLSLTKDTTEWISINHIWDVINEDNTAVFSSGSPPGARPIVAGGGVAETLNVNHTNGTAYAYPSSGANQTALAALVASVTARAGWASGNALGFVDQSDQNAATPSGTGRETVACFDAATLLEPQLIIDYTPAPATLDQEGFRFRNDDGSETTATWAAAQDTDVTKAISSALRLRILINGTADPASQQYQLEYKKSTDSTWKKVV